MSDMGKVVNKLYVSNDFLASVLKGGDIKFMADLHNDKLNNVQRKHGYIANYQIYKNNSLKVTSSDIVIHFDHIREIGRAHV